MVSIGGYSTSQPDSSLDEIGIAWVLSLAKVTCKSPRFHEWFGNNNLLRAMFPHFKNFPYFQCVVGVLQHHTVANMIYQRGFHSCILIRAVWLDWNCHVQRIYSLVLSSVWYIKDMHISLLILGILKKQSSLMSRYFFEQKSFNLNSEFGLSRHQNCSRASKGPPPPTICRCLIKTATRSHSSGASDIT